MNIEEARNKVLKFNPGMKIMKEASYKNLYVFIIAKENDLFSRTDPVCVNADTGVISVFLPDDKETFLAVTKLLK
jgi:hypothetical protein